MKLESESNNIYSQADVLFATKDLWYNLCLELFRAKVQYGRETNDSTRVETITVSACGAPNNFLGNDKLKLG